VVVVRVTVDRSNEPPDRVHALEVLRVGVLQQPEEECIRRKCIRRKCIRRSV
jgi:hypothetical protein